MTAFNDTFGIIGLSSENVGIDRRIYTGLTSTNPQLNVSYNSGRVDVYLNGVKLMGNHSGQNNYDYTYQGTGQGSAITLSTSVALVATDTIECVGYVSNSSNTVTSYNPTPANADGGWNVFASISHSASDLVNVFLNGVLLDDSDYTLDSANNKVTIGSPTLTASDVVVIQVIGALDNSNFVPAGGGTFSGNVSFGDNNITNVGDIAVDTISSDAGTSIGVTLGTDSGDDFNVGGGKLVVEGDTGKVGIGTDAPSDLNSAANDLVVKNTTNAGITIFSGSQSSGNLFFADATSGTAEHDGFLQYSQNDQNLDIGTAGASRVQVQQGGNLKINDGDLVIGTAGHGIDFSAQTQSTSSTGSEVLDHYEEGTWTIDVQGSTTAGTDTIGGQLSNYTRIGRLVNVNVWFNLTNLTGYSGGTLKFAGLPFQSKASCDAVGTCMIQNHDFTYDAKQLTLYIGSSYNYFLVYVSRDDAGWLQINDDTAFDMIASLTYYTT